MISAVSITTKFYRLPRFTRRTQLTAMWRLYACQFLPALHRSWNCTSYEKLSFYALQGIFQAMRFVTPKLAQIQTEQMEIWCNKKKKCHRFWPSSCLLEISLWSHLSLQNHDTLSSYYQSLFAFFYICLFLVISTVVYPFVLICCPCRTLVSSANSTLLTNRSVCYINHAFISIIKSEKHDNYLSMEKVMMTIIKHFLKRLTWKYPIH